MAPLLRRSWAPTGHTPVIHQRTRHHQRVSMIAALCVSPNRDHVYCYFRLHPGVSITGAEVLHFLRQLLRQLQAPMVIIWDRLNAHRSRMLRPILRQPSELSTFFLPPYAPELNPVENIWSYLKMNPMANCAIHDLIALALTTRNNGRRLQKNQLLLRAFLKHTPLPLRLK